MTIAIQSATRIAFQGEPGAASVGQARVSGPSGRATQKRDLP
jgi:hypothetical protein